MNTARIALTGRSARRLLGTQIERVYVANAACHLSRQQRHVSSSRALLSSMEGFEDEKIELTKEERAERAQRLKSKKERPILKEKDTGEPLKDHEKIFFEDFEEGEEIKMVPRPPIADENGNIPIEPHIYDLVDRITKLSLVEICQISDFFQARLAARGIDVSCTLGPGSFGGGGGGGGGAAAVEAEAPKEEKTKFEVKLTGFDAKSKIKVIKEVRAITGLGLKEAKALVEGAPKSVKKDVKQEEADELKEKLEAVGATIEIE
eukprot:CAMPEP_0116034378 /NCGR_PEP_ID=MMETSP0321-20121206/19582_1 /TAXON_ID=163516 /ORGANISM="Leptocylindrus danicus var. danicus, Strain B650" /LENGTH=262 /DNA_ID=CAMNT_0003510699 /DNA_START=102 /DNA_END=890 /DNA_ORIENTATION=+